MSIKSVIGWAVFIAGAAFVAGVESPATFEPWAPGWTKWSAGARQFADAHGLIFVGKKQEAPPAGRPRSNVSVETVQRGPLPFLIQAVGTVQPVASIAIRSRIDAQIAEILKNDGDAVKAGDTLVKLDDRQLLAQIRQSEALLAKDKAAVEQSTRDAGRAGTLLSSGTGPLLNLQNAQTQLKAAQAAVAADEAQLNNLRVQDTWYTLSSPISGRLGVFSLKAGNILRTADTTATGNLVTINQMSPIYVAFPIPQVLLPRVREALALGPVKVIATPQGSEKAGAEGQITELDNVIDSGTGTLTIRATFPNADELLWPGQLCNLEITLWTDPDDVTITRRGLVERASQDFVYIIENNVAHRTRIEVSRYQNGLYVVTSGLKGGETIVDDGKDFIRDGTPVNVRPTPGSQTADAGAPKQ